MAKFRCRCGHEMRLTGADSPYEFSLIPEAAVVNISDQLESGNVSSENFFDEIDKVSRLVYRCTECDRLYVKNESSVFDVYVKELL